MRTKEERQAALARKFREVGAERISRVNLAWVRLEQDAKDAETAAELLREVHTLKGEAKTVGLPEISAFAHRLETLLFKARDARFQVPRATSDAVLGAVDALAALLSRPESAPPLDVSEAQRRLDAAIALQEGAAPGAPHQATAPGPEPKAAADVAQTLRVPVSRITSISDVTGELLVEQTKIAFSVAQLREGFAQMDALLQQRAASAADQPLREVVGHFGRGLHDLDESVYRLSMQVKEMDRTTRDLRLVPVSSLLGPYARMVRDLAAEQGKDAALDLQGGEVEADKRVLETLSEPMLHVLRNAVDHGLELPEERARAGKPTRGKIAVSVKTTGSTLTLTVADDGRGLDPGALRARAVARGFLDPAAAERLPADAALALIFQPGFSTRDEVTSLSGRGVGMDIVKRRVEQLSGRVSVSGAPGRGLRLQITVPVSVSMTRALVLQVGQHLCAVPSASIESIRQVTAESLVTTHQGRAMRVDGSILPLLQLEELLTGGCDPRARVPVGLVLRSGAERRVVQVSEPGREADLVVKPLGPPLRAMKLVNGAAVLESGALVLMLDVAALLERAQLGGAQGAKVGQASRTVRKAKILVVDDSVILRTMLTSIVKELGYQVETAADGVEGLAALEAGGHDLVITDLQMPRLDGLELLRALRADPRWARLPVVILSSLGSPEDRRRGVEAGADAYLVKNELTDEAVGQLLARFLH